MVLIPDVTFGADPQPALNAADAKSERTMHPRRIELGNRMMPMMRVLQESNAGRCQME